MAQLEGAFVAAQFERIDTFEWTDPQGQIKPIRRFVTLMEFGDGKRDWVDIGFPRDPAYRAPSLSPKTKYVFPVLVGVDRKKNAVPFTIRTDIQPFEAPDIT